MAFNIDFPMRINWWFGLCTKHVCLVNQYWVNILSNLRFFHFANYWRLNKRLFIFMSLSFRVCIQGKSKGMSCGWSIKYRDRSSINNKNTSKTLLILNICCLAEKHGFRYNFLIQLTTIERKCAILRYPCPFDVYVAH